MEPGEGQIGSGVVLLAVALLGVLAGVLPRRHLSAGSTVVSALAHRRGGSSGAGPASVQ